MTVRKKSNLPDLIRFFAKRVPGVGRTQLIKFLYLADLESRRCLGEPISDLKYIWYDHGPFDSTMLACLDLLSSMGFIKEEVEEYDNATKGYRITVTDKPLPNEAEFSEEQTAILNHVVATYGRMPLKKLLRDVVYKTTPMTDAIERDAKEHLLRMELVDNERRQHGYDLSRVIRSVRHLDEGKGRSFTERRNDHPSDLYSGQSALR